MARRKLRKAEMEQEIKRLERELEEASRQSPHDYEHDRHHAEESYNRGTRAAPTRVTVSLPPQEHYDGQGRPWEGFIFSFRSLAEACKWDEREQRFRLLACLRGDAADFVFQQLSADVVNDLDKLIAALEGRFAARKTPTAFVSQLESRRLGPKETISDYAADIRRLTTFGYPTADAATMEMIATRHFLRGLGDNSMSMTIGMQEPKTLQEAREIAERYHHLREEAVRNTSRSGIRSVSSSEATSVTEEKLATFERRLMSNFETRISQLSEDIQTQLRQRNNDSRQYQGQPRDRPRARSTPLRCYECQELGHIAKNCPHRRYYPRNNMPQQFNTAWPSNITTQEQGMPQWMPQPPPPSSMPPNHQPFQQPQSHGPPPQQPFQQQPPHGQPTSGNRSSGN